MALVVVTRLTVGYGHSRVRAYACKAWRRRPLDSLVWSSRVHSGLCAWSTNDSSYGFLVVIVKPILFNNTVLRDGHQSMAATRMTTAQMLPPAPILDGMGFHGLETWGGATIDSCLRFLNENPFDRLRTLKKAAPKTPQIMLLRGQNIVQYASFPDDVVEAFVRCMCENGQDIIRIFDALNDVRNLATAIKAVKVRQTRPRRTVLHHQPGAHGGKLRRNWASSWRKWAATPSASRTCRAFSSRKSPTAWSRNSRARSVFRSRCTRTTRPAWAPPVIWRRLRPGVDCVEVSIVPFANGTSQPDTQRMLALLEGHPRCPKFDTRETGQVARLFRGRLQGTGQIHQPGQ